MRDVPSGEKSNQAPSLTGVGPSPVTAPPSIEAIPIGWISHEDVRRVQVPPIEGDPFAVW